MCRWWSSQEDSAPSSRTDAQLELAARLEAVKAGAPLPTDPPANPFEPLDGPHVVDGIIVPASSVAGHAAYEYAPAANVLSVRATRRGIVAYMRNGKPYVLWIGDDDDARDAALVEFLREFGSTSSRRR